MPPATACLAPALSRPHGQQEAEQASDEPWEANNEQKNKKIKKKKIKPPRHQSAPGSGKCTSNEKADEINQTI